MYQLATWCSAGVLIVISIVIFILAKSTAIVVGKITVHNAATLVLFAALGSVASVMQRVRTMKFDLNLSAANLIREGIARPIIAVIFAFILLMMVSKDWLSFGPIRGIAISDDSVAVGIMAFVASFSERAIPEYFVSKAWDVVRKE